MMIWQQCSDLNPLSIGYLCWRQVAWSPGALTGHAYYWQKCLQELASQVGFISFSSTFITMINFSYLCTDYVNEFICMIIIVRWLRVLHFSSLFCFHWYHRNLHYHIRYIMLMKESIGTYKSYRRQQG